MSLFLLPAKIDGYVGSVASSNRSNSWSCSLSDSWSSSIGCFRFFHLGCSLCSGLGNKHINLLRVGAKVIGKVSSRGPFSDPGPPRARP